MVVLYNLPRVNIPVHSKDNSATEGRIHPWPEDVLEETGMLFGH